MDAEQVGQMLERLGPDAVDIVEISRIEDGTWLVGFDDESGIAIEYLASPPRLMVTSALGRPPIDRRFVVYETLLSFNALWRDSPGTRLALNGADGEVMVVCEHAAAELTSAQLQSVLAAHAEFAREWRHYVLAEAPPVHLPPPMMFGRYA
jgi:hypothetical protein